MTSFRKPRFPPSALPSSNEVPTEGYTRWDLGIDYALPLGRSELITFLNLNKITDEEIRLSTSLLRDVAPEAGQSLEPGLRYRL